MDGHFSPGFTFPALSELRNFEISKIVGFTKYKINDHQANKPFQIPSIANQNIDAEPPPLNYKGSIP